MTSSFVATILNEENTIKDLLESLYKQTQKPDEIIITDGGSRDKTIKIIKEYEKQNKFPVTLLRKKGNRSVGRNFAIKHAKGDIILSSDAGCVLEKNWVKNITKPFLNKDIHIVAGYYKGKAKSVFEKCLVPYVLVMPDKIDSQNFLPASRSMALRKNIFLKLGGFDTRYSHNEDFVFAKKAFKKGIRPFFARDAISFWIPRKNYKDAYTMFFRFAYGDIESGIIRPKVVLIFLRYFLGVILILLAIKNSSFALLMFFMICFLLYISWTVLKNYRYVEDILAIFILPTIQVVSDIAVLLGSTLGFIKRYMI